MKIAYLGPIGSFCSVVAEAAFKKEELLPYETILDVIEAYDSGACDFALVPIENSTEGTVNMSIDKIFHDSKAEVMAEFVLPISQNLLAVNKNQKIEHIYSHPQALAQTRAYLREFYPQAKVEITESTSAAAEFVKNHPNLPAAAVANSYAAKMYDLEILAKNIQDLAGNSTRFWLLGKKHGSFDLRKTEEKVSLALTLPENMPGALHKAISVFAWRDIDMTKIESRPLKTRLGQYFFIIDLVNNEVNNLKIPYALEELAGLGVTVRLLGNYSVYSLGEV